MAVSPPQTAPTISTRLAELISEERELSIQRGRLHRAIDRLYLTAPLGSESISQLEQLEAFEQDISARRRQLHREIDALRAEANLPRVSAEHDHAA